MIDSPEKDERCVTLAENELLRILGEQVTSLLSSQSSHEMPVQDFMQSFARFDICYCTLVVVINFHGRVG